jgi:hypothetical protein
MDKVKMTTRRQYVIASTHVFWKHVIAESIIYSCQCPYLLLRALMLSHHLLHHFSSR